MERFNEKPRVKAFNEYHQQVLFVIDRSGSMSGTPLQNAIAGINNFREFISKQSDCRDCVDVAVIAFDDEAELIVDWTPASEMQPISISAGGCTDLAAALKLAVETHRRQSDVYYKNGIVEKKPFCILLTDGYHNGSTNLDEAVALVDHRIVTNKMKLFFLGYGEYDKATAAQLTQHQGCFAFEVTGPDAPFKDFFDFVNNSVKAASESSPGASYTVDTKIGTDESPVKINPLNAWLND